MYRKIYIYVGGILYRTYVSYRKCLKQSIRRNEEIIFDCPFVRETINQTCRKPQGHRGNNHKAIRLDPTSPTIISIIIVISIGELHHPSYTIGLLSLLRARFFLLFPLLCMQ